MHFMRIDELQIDIQKFKDKVPEAFNEIANLTVPFYMFHTQMDHGISRLLEDRYKISHSELDVLSSLRMSGDDGFILSPTRLHEKLLFTSGAITKILKKLEDKKYIKRLDNKYDKRSKLVQLTALGNDIQAKSLKEVLAFEEKCFEPLTLKEKETMKKLFIKALKHN